ncbi:MAG: hypothetical protein ABI604_15965 [Nitrospirota bacterium]
MIGRRHHTGRYLALLGLLLCLGLPMTANAVPMLNDPNGFQSLIWGVALAARPDLEIARAGPHVNEYQLRDGPPSYAGVSVESLRFLSVDEQFARVTIHYQGEDRHKQILAYLERQFGSLDRVPGQMMRGLNQQYTWRGTDTEINVTYHANTERGFVFIDSRTLAPRFNDRITDSAE